MLRVRELSVRFHTEAGSFLPVERISFDLERGGALALIGESGSGKSTVALSLLRLLPPGAEVAGSVELLGQDLLALGERELPGIRGRKIAMVFHDPLAALNPVQRIGAQIGETLGKRDREAVVIDLLRTVGLAAQDADRYPHQLSGGMRQRALIAMAIACGPQVLVADEPTSALDPVVQAEIVALLRGLREERGLSLLLATHDLSLAARLCDAVAVLYAGRIVERGPAAQVLTRPRHPYTLGLLRSLPPRAEPIAGSAEAPWARPSGCRFRTRCPRAQDDCAQAEPELDAAGVACFHPLEN